MIHKKYQASFSLINNNKKKYFRILSAAIVIGTLWVKHNAFKHQLTNVLAHLSWRLMMIYIIHFPSGGVHPSTISDEFFSGATRYFFFFFFKFRVKLLESGERKC